MKKTVKIFILTTTLLIGSLTACGQVDSELEIPEVQQTQTQEINEQEVLEQQAEQTYIYGNSIGNIYNRGLFFSDEENNLYVYSAHASGLFKVNSEDSSAIPIEDSSLFYASKVGDMIYGVKYSEDGDDAELVAYSLVDNTYTRICDGEVSCPQVVNQKLYYTDETNNYLRCYDIESKEETILLEKAVYYPMIVEDIVYFQMDSDGESLYSMSLLDGSLTKLNSIRSYLPLIYKDKIYYSSADENEMHSFRCMNLDGTEDTHLADITIATANIYKDTYYFLDADHRDVISYIDLTAETIEVQTLDLQNEVKEKFLERWGDLFTPNLILTNYHSYNFADNKMLFYVDVVDNYIYLGGEGFIYDLETGEVELVYDKYGLGELENTSDTDEDAIQSQEPEETTVINYPSGDYSVGSIYGPKLSQQELNEVAEVVNQFLATYNTSAMTDYQKVETAHDYLCQNVTYAASWKYNGANTAWGALVYGEAQCSGYARAMKALCDAMDVGCYYVHADENAINPSHQWNEVCVDGNWYIIDVQCNDDSGFRAFFLVSDDTYAGAGLSWDRSNVPVCPNDY